jgi:hypothetical protein
MFNTPRKSFSKFFCAIAATIVVAVAATTAHSARELGTKVNASGYVLQLNGRPFVIKGMNYSPVPIGTAPGNPPYGDYFISTTCATTT